MESLTKKTSTSFCDSENECSYKEVDSHNAIAEEKQLSHVFAIVINDGQCVSLESLVCFMGCMKYTG